MAIAEATYREFRIRRRQSVATRVDAIEERANTILDVELAGENPPERVVDDAIGNAWNDMRKA